MRYETARELVETILDQLDEKRESPDVRTDRDTQDRAAFKRGH